MKRLLKRVASKPFACIVALILAVIVAPALAYADGETQIVNHNSLKHKPYSAIHQDFGPQTVYLKCDWEAHIPPFVHQQCEFHDWILISMPHIWTYYNGQPWEPKFVWQARRNYPFIESHEGLPSGVSIVNAFTYEGIEGTVYGPTYEAPVDPGHYRFYTVIRVPHTEDPFGGITGYFKLEAELHIRSSAFTLSFDANHPNSASTKKQASGTMNALAFASIIDEKQLPQNQFKLPGYRFMGWNTKADGTGTRYADQEFVKGVNGISKYGDNVTLYAQWEPLEYTITFKDPSNDPSRPDLEQTAYFDQPGTLMDVTSADVASQWSLPDSSKLQGWSVSGVGLFYEDQAPFCNLCDVDAKGGVSGLTLNASFVYAGQIIVAITKDGVAQANVADSFTLTDQHNTVFTVPTTYDNGRYIFDPTKAVSPAGTPGNLPKGDYTLTFPGSNLPMGTAKIVYGPDSAATATLDYYTVKAEPVAGDKGIASVAVRGMQEPVVVYGPQELVAFEGSTVNLSTSTMTGYHFDGYSVVGVEPKWENGNPTVPNQSITIMGTAEIAAHSVPNSYTIHFDANTTRPVMGEMEDVVATYDQEQNLSANQFAVAGGTFLGWNTQADGKGVSYADKAEILNLTSEDGTQITLYAQWAIKQVKVSFVDYNRASLYETMVDYGTVPVYEGDEPTRAADAQNTYTFAGWDPEVGKVIEATTYTAHYDATPIPPVQATLTFDLGGGTLNGQTGSLTIAAKVGDVIEIPAAPKREGYNFKYWKGSEYHPGDKYTVTGNHTFTAVWEKNADPAPQPMPTPDPKPKPAIPATGDLLAGCGYGLLGLIGASGAFIAQAGYARKKRRV